MAKITQITNIQILNKMEMYKLVVKETGNKSARFHYQVIDESGNVISERSSNRVYEACTINGEFYFGRIDLIGKGDHGRLLRWCEINQLTDEQKERMILRTTIAYK